MVKLRNMLQGALSEPFIRIMRFTYPEDADFAKSEMVLFIEPDACVYADGEYYIAQVAKYNEDLLDARVTGWTTTILPRNKLNLTEDEGEGVPYDIVPILDIYVDCSGIPEVRNYHEGTEYGAKLEKLFEEDWDTDDIEYGNSQVKICKYMCYDELKENTGNKKISEEGEEDG